jgi:hypothetical protein
MFRPQLKYTPAVIALQRVAATGHLKCDAPLIEHDSMRIIGKVLLEGAVQYTRHLFGSEAGFGGKCCRWHL